MNAPAYVAYAVLGGNVAMIAALLFGLHLALARSGWPPDQRASVWRWTFLVLIAWFGTVLALSWVGLFRSNANRVPMIAIGIFVPIAVGAVALSRSETLTRIVDAVPQYWLVGVQFYRTVGLIFLILLGSGKLPAVFALPAGLNDVLVGVLAPVVAILYARGAPGREHLVRAWNMFGILDLVTAVGTGFLTSPSPFQLLSFEAPNVLISTFPLVMIPVFAVPLSVLLHLMSLTKLQRTKVQDTASHSTIRAQAF